MTMPAMICPTANAPTTQKYLWVAFMDGVGSMLRSGSAAGVRTWLRQTSRLAAKNHASPPMPPSSSTKLMTEVTTMTGVAWLPTRSSGGQLCV